MTDRDTLLQELYNLRAVTMDQAARLWFEGNREQTYDVIDKLKKEGFVVTRRFPKDQRARYVCVRPVTVDERNLDRDGRKYILPDLRMGPKLIASNELYVMAVEAGIPRSVLVPRHHCYARFKLTDTTLPLRWMLELGKTRYAMYGPRNGRYTHGLGKKISRLPADAFTGHLVFYSNILNMRRDTQRFLRDSPALNFHVLTFEDMPRVKELLLTPNKWLETVQRRLAVIAPGSRIVPSPDPRADWAVERKGKTLLADLRLENVGAAAALNTFTEMELRQRNYEGVLFLVKDVKQAKEWGKLLGWREWHWFLVEAEPVESSLFKVEKQALRLVRRHAGPEPPLERRIQRLA